MGAIFSRLVGPFLLVAFLLCGVSGPARTQSKPPAKAVLTQSAAVVEKLKKDGIVPTKPAEPNHDLAADQVKAFAGPAEVVLGSYPELWRNLTRIPLIARQERERRKWAWRILRHALRSSRGGARLRSFAAPGPGQRQAPARRLHNRHN
jgi:hypothetical protein